MQRTIIMAFRLWVASGFLLVLAGCPGSGGPKVVVYCALDREYAQPIFDSFRKQTNIQVLPKYDAESTKTVQLTTAILMESKTRTRCDLFWNNEILNTLRLDREGLLDTYRPPNASAFPPSYQSPHGRWYGFAARARVLLVNTDIVSKQQMPSSIYDLLEPKWKGKIAIAKPLFGSTATHAVCLFEALGPEQAKAFFDGLKANEVQILSGNKQVAEDVSQGRIAFGLTDTDDAMIELEQGFPVAMIYPDSQPGELGTLFFPNTLALLRDSPHQEAARKLLDYLLTSEVETRLAQGPSAQIPLHEDVQLDLPVESPDTVQAMQIDFESAADRWEEVGNYLQARFLLESP